MSNALLRRQVPHAGVQALAILDPARGPLEAPIRSEIFGAARFAQHGRSLGLTHAARLGGGAPAFFPRLRDNIRVLDEAHHYIGLQEHSGHHVSPAGEWLLDNFHIVAAQTKEIHEGLPRRYFRDLPVLVDAHLAGLPRVYGVAWAFVAHTDSAFDEALIGAFLSAYQESRDLTLGELWALPTTLRVVLIENLRRVSERVAASKAARELANQWCDRLEALPRTGTGHDADAADASAMFELAQQRGVGTAFALQVQQRLQAEPQRGARGHEATLAAVRAALALALPDPAGAQVQQQAEQAANNLSVSNAITSLRLLGDTDWRSLIAQTSALMQLLQASPIFRAERDDTQDATLHAIEKLARRSDCSELEVARCLLGLMQAQPSAGEADAEAPSHSPSYWLRGRGRPALRQALGLRPAVLPGWSLLRSRVVLPLYLGTIVLASLGLTAWFVLHHRAPDASELSLALLAGLALWPASEAVIAVLNRLISESVPPRRLPRLALAEGIPPEHRVLVVVPTMLTSLAGIAAMARQLERHHLANQEAHAQFALLSDGADADTEQVIGDAELLAAAVAAVDELEASYPPPQADGPRRFLLMHRGRRWSDTEQRWIGWERKRGKLEQLIVLMAEGGASPFVDLGPRSTPAADTPYIVTLDSDTLLPPGALRELVGVAAHPLNRPVIDEARRRVASGFGILQPRIATPLPTLAEATPFHWLFAGAGGIDPYSAATSEVYQDLFAEGTFTGKGLLQVQALHAVLAQRLPEGQVLSHDLLEGSIARCGSVSDITLIEDAPLHVDVAASRVHRWTRGDWQLLPLWLNPRRYGLRTINRWKMLDNLRRSLVAPLSVVLLVLCLAGAGPAWPALALVAAAFGGGPLLGAIAGLAPSRDDVALRHFYRDALADVGRALGVTAWSVLMLASSALGLVDAIVRALWRSFVSRRHLLQWTTAAAAEAAARHDLAGLAKRHVWVSVFALVLLGALLAFGTPNPLLATVLCLAWAATPLSTWWASRPRPRPPTQQPGPRGRDYLEGVAHDAWRLFAEHVTAEHHDLPPDNVQTSPSLMVAHRTSPTNIGLYLLACACAQRFGWIDIEDWLGRCERTLTTLGQLQRHRGHLLNWYDTRTLAPLPPAYVSTVDSGNLCGHLAALASACDEVAVQLERSGDEATRQRLLAVAAHSRRFALEAEFGFLFDARRRLFHIGYRVADQALDKSYYDLLASESRLASLWAIAKGDVPVSHWAALGRPFFADWSHAGHDAGLRSWSGSMFEYLMASLVVDEPAGSALHSAARAAVHEQMAYATTLGVPWGMSESAYASSDHTLAYQYSPQGVPRLALRRTPPDEIVIAPYATALAAMVEPRAATANLRRLQTLNARTALGFVEALDYTAERQVGEGGYTVVSTFMAHHQGMTIVALANLLLGNAPRRWGMADARLGAVASLLQERVPREVSRLLEPPPSPSRPDPREPTPGSIEVVPGAAALQPTQLLSNGRYGVALRANGAGWSRHEGIDISRWRDDALRDAHGTFFYLRRSTNPAPVSLTQHPAPDPNAHYQASFHGDRVCLDAEWPDLRTRCTVWVSPEDDIELRRIELWNIGERPITLELMSMFEVALGDARADETHPAFAKLFVQAEWDASDRALYFARRPRTAGEAGHHAVHFVAHADESFGAMHAQTDRTLWLGRNREVSSPLASYASPNGAADETVAHPPMAAAGAPTTAQPRPTGLDPIAALSTRLQLPAHGTAQITYATAAAPSRALLETLVDRYRQPTIIERSTLMSATFASIRLREMRLNVDDRAAVQTLSTALAMLHTRPAVASGEPGCDRRTLWRVGISGDRPMLVVNASGVHSLRMVRALVQGLRLWSWGGLLCDLVVLNAEPRSYLMPLQRELQALLDRYLADGAAAAPTRWCGLRVLHVDELSTEERATLAVLGRVRLTADGRPLAHHVQELVEWHDTALDDRLSQASTTLAAPAFATRARPPHGEFDAASGGFRFTVTGARRPPRPWVNVLANPDFGAQVSEAGAGYTWAGNSRLHQLTSWSNDPVTDASGESFYLQDLRSRELWAVGPGFGGADVSHAIEHDAGVTTIRHRRGDVEVTSSWCVDTAASVKRVRIGVRNSGPRTQRLRAIGVMEWVMGAARAERQSIRTAFETIEPHGRGGMPVDALLATQTDAHAGFGGSTAFLALRVADDARFDEWTCDRRELFDARGRRVLPDHFGEHAGLGLDPCAAVSASLQLGAGESAEFVFVVGHGAQPAAARQVAREAVPADAAACEAAVRAHWAALQGAVTVATPDPLFDALVNHWLLYQTVGCRLWGRAGFYQAGGAFGFRDQLQDTMALASAAPELLRAQLLLSASRQFAEGDVQHWWHAPTGAGVRTHFSDDLLWLPYATAHYVEVVGDAGVLDETVPFLEGDPIPPGAEDAYYVPRISATTATLYEHAARTIDRSLAVGVHGLPLMGSGDWNDGMNRVGIEGRGESVWLGWFLCRVVEVFMPLAKSRGDVERVRSWSAASAGWRAALQATAWDGEWFARAFFDDGSALGSHANAECRIDLIAQAWSVLSGAATPLQQRSAMASAQRQLVDEPHGLIRLLDPPLANAVPSAGYIQAYPPGVRENGGQYSHAGVWWLMAQAALGDADGAWRSFTRLSPAHRSADPQQGAAYELEPYVMAGDVYTHPPYVGRGGWSWYTGSAAWMYRAAIESICGLQRRAGRVRVRPQLPGHWPQIVLTLTHGGQRHEIVVCAASAAAEIARERGRGTPLIQAGEWLDLDAAGVSSRHFVVATKARPLDVAASLAALDAAA